MAEASRTWYSCVLTEFNQDSCLNNHRCEIMLKTWKTISLLGALFNTVPFLILCFEPRLRKCRFCGFLLLAFTDFLSLFLKYLSIQIRSRLKETSEITQFIFNILLISANVCSFLHIILLSVQKVIMTTCPPRCQNWITKKTSLLASLLAWIVSLGMGTLFMFKMGKGNIEEKKLFIKVYSVTVFTFPTTLLGILLILTPIIKKLKSGPLPDNSDQNTHSHQTASRITCMLAVAYIITTTPLHVKEILQYFICFITDPWFFVLHHVGTSLTLVNHAIHSLIYILNVIRFRTIYHGCLAMKQKCLGRSFETTTITTATTTAEEQKNPVSLKTYRQSSC